MSHFPHGAFVAIQAANEQRRWDQEEEEEMTRYSVEELDTHWEFKSVRSESGAFRKPEVFAALLQEEQIAGWELVKKLDDRRVRFKRPRDARRRDATLPPGFDPYRTHYGGSSAARIIILITVALLIAVGFGVTLLANVGAISGATPVIMITVGVMMMMVLIALIALRRTQK
ncbi:MAG: hypothetical protein JW757_06830 [Anaerolineales bacterium]|nr:hypothetical protein [Anaerolineales bacterium]